MATTPAALVNVPGNQKKKATVKRRLDFSASDYRCKKKSRVINAAAVPSKIPLTAHVRLSRVTLSQHVVIGQLIWGKLKGYDWWPGCIVSYSEARQTPPPPDSHWVKWFGDDKVSQLASTSIQPFSEISDKINSAKIRGMFKKALFNVLEVAATRCGKVFTKSNNSVGHSTPQRQQPKGSIPAEKDLASNSETRSYQESQDEMLKWALNGFQPSGPSGFQPHQLEDISSEPAPPLAPIVTDLQQTDVSSSTNLKSRFGKPVSEPSLSGKVKAVFDEVVIGKRPIEEICLACGDTNVHTAHPLFEGGLCKDCKRSFLECAYLFDEDGSQMYCTICGDGNEVFLCDNPGCFRSYCNLCVGMLCGKSAVASISARETWVCYMCSGKRQRLIKRRSDWSVKLQDLFMNDKEKDFKIQPGYPPIPPEGRAPIRVLALFDGIATGFQALKDLGFEVELYCTAEIDEQAIQVAKVHHGDKITHLGDIKDITEEQIQELGPFDLVIGGSPCNDLSIANPARKGIFEGSGRLFFEFYRLLNFARPKILVERPFFWLFENVVGMRAEDKITISRFLQVNPVVVDAKDISPAHRARYFWGNLPGMNRGTVPLPGDKLCLQECLESNCGRQAKFDKVQTVTTNPNSMRQTQKGLLPVQVVNSDGQQREDILWITEMERLFGFPSHYTDVNNMGRTQRQRLLGKSWSVPVIRHLMSPLKDYFKCVGSVACAPVTE